MGRASERSKLHGSGLKSWRTILVWGRCKRVEVFASLMQVRMAELYSIGDFPLQT